MLGALLGAAATPMLDRRLPPIKLAFNLAQLALAACVAFVIVRALAGAATASSPRTWLAALRRHAGQRRADHRAASPVRSRSPRAP